MKKVMILGLMFLLFPTAIFAQKSFVKKKKKSVAPITEAPTCSHNEERDPGFGDWEQYVRETPAVVWELRKEEGKFTRLVWAFPRRHILVREYVNQDRRTVPLPIFVDSLRKIPKKIKKGRRYMITFCSRDFTIFSMRLMKKR